MRCATSHAGSSTRNRKRTTVPCSRAGELPRLEFGLQVWYRSPSRPQGSKGHAHATGGRSHRMSLIDLPAFSVYSSCLACDRRDTATRSSANTNGVRSSTHGDRMYLWLTASPTYRVCQLRQSVSHAGLPLGTLNPLAYSKRVAP